MHQLFSRDDALAALVQEVVNQVLQAEGAEHLGTWHYERTEAQQGYRNGYRPRVLKTRVGKLTLQVPKVRGGGLAVERGGGMKLWIRGVGRFSRAFPNFVEIEADIHDVAGLLDWVCREHGFEPGQVRLSGNKTVIVLLDGMPVHDPHAPLADGNRVTLLPVVAGG